ncbi:hypothetical protein MN608_10611 [Microdochium nivale]|nr:hypothetical protein MN608_10611 [Microdochium nivale]
MGRVTSGWHRKTKPKDKQHTAYNRRNSNLPHARVATTTIPVNAVPFTKGCVEPACKSELYLLLLAMAGSRITAEGREEGGYLGTLELGFVSPTSASGSLLR